MFKGLPVSCTFLAVYLVQMQRYICGACQVVWMCGTNFIGTIHLSWISHIMLMSYRPAWLHLSFGSNLVVV